MNVDIYLEGSKRSGYYSTSSATITGNEKEIKGTEYKVILGAGPGTQQTYKVYRDTNSKWIINPLETEPILCDEIRYEIDKIEQP